MHRTPVSQATTFRLDMQGPEMSAEDAYIATVCSTKVNRL